MSKATLHRFTMREKAAIIIAITLVAILFGQPVFFSLIMPLPRYTPNNLEIMSPQNITDTDPLLLPGEERQQLPIVRDPNFELQLVFSGLQHPTSMEFVGPNDILVLNKNDGKVLRIIDGALLNQPLLDVEVANLVERGMLGIAVTKNANGPTYVFLYFTESKVDGDDATNNAAPLGARLYRYELTNDTLQNEKLLIDIPAGRGGSHIGGKVLIGPDNNVYLVVGDIASHKTRAQNYANGTFPIGTSVIWRINQDGNSAGAILGTEEPINKFYAYGIRNSFGMDFDPVTGKLWDTENGPDHGDEINLVEPGFNSGWGVVMGFPNNSQHFDADTELVKCLYCTAEATAPWYFWIIEWAEKNISGIRDGVYSDPKLAFTPPVAPTALKFLNSDKLGKQYENDIFFGDILYGNLYHFELNDNRDALSLNGSLSDKMADSLAELDSHIFAQGFRGITDIKVGPDGYLYILTYTRPDGEGAIYRIVPKDLSESNNSP
jgi:aldose sugar dehydrogenase